MFYKRAFPSLIRINVIYFSLNFSYLTTIYIENQIEYYCSYVFFLLILFVSLDFIIFCQWITIVYGTLCIAKNKEMLDIIINPQNSKQLTRKIAVNEMPFIEE